jgi:hypothetical protein
MMGRNPDFMTRKELLAFWAMIALIAVLWDAVAALAFTLVKGWLA